MITDVSKLDLSKRTMSKLSGKKKTKKPYVIESSLSSSTKSENLELLRQAELYWNALRDFRTRRKKNRKYYRGDQWHEVMVNPDYDSTITDSSDYRSMQYITEETYILNQGKIPFKQNLIRQLGKNILGQYRANPTESIVMARQRDKATEADIMSNALLYARSINHSQELEARNCEEFMLSGAAITYIGYKYIKERDGEDVWHMNDNPNRIYFNNDLQDIRLTDLTTIGRIIDMPLDSVISSFAKTKADDEKIRQFYAGTQNEIASANEALTPDNIDNLDFYNPIGTDKCRVFEHWYLKTEWRLYVHDYIDGSYSIVDMTEKEIDAINTARIAAGGLQGIPPEMVPLMEYDKKKEQFWYVKFLTPRGDCLWEGESPYMHQEHPFAVTLYPLLDGEVWSIVEDVIDQQRYINRLIALYDFIMGASAKGVLMVDEDMVNSSSMTPEQWASEWTKFNGVIMYKSRPGVEVPYQISSNSTNIGISEMLQLQLKLFQEITGVSEAIQGQTPKSGTPSSLYAQQAQNSLINIKDFFEVYAWHRKKIDMKTIKVIKQFYKEERYLAISGSVSNPETLIYNPERIKNLEFDNEVVASTDTPVYRAIIDDTLMQLLNAKLIDLEMYLENSSMPLANRLLESIKLRKEQMMDQQQAMGEGQAVPPELAQQIQAGSNPQAADMINRMFAQGQN